MESELAVSCLYKGFHFNFDFGRGIHADSSWFEERDRQRSVKFLFWIIKCRSMASNI